MPTNNWNVFHLIFFWILSLLCILILSYTIHVFQKQPAHSYNKKFILLSFGGLITSNLHCICFAISYIFMNINGEKFSYQVAIWAFGDTISEISYIISCISMYLVFLYKIQIAFQGTKYQISNKICYICYIVMVTMLVLKLIDSTVDALWGLEMLSSKLFNFWNVFYFVTLEAIDLLLSAVLISLFVKKLINITVDLGDDEPLTKSTDTTITDNSYSNANSVQLNNTQKGLLNVITKHCVLSITSVISAQIYFLTIAIIFTLYDFAHFNATNGETSALNIAFIFWGIDGLINCLCMCMNLDFNHKIYYVLCGKCHSYCKLWCSQRTKSKIMYKHLKNEELKQQLINL